MSLNTTVGLYKAIVTIVDELYLQDPRYYMCADIADALQHKYEELELADTSKFSRKVGTILSQEFRKGNCVLKRIRNTDTAQKGGSYLYGSHLLTEHQ